METGGWKVASTRRLENLRYRDWHTAARYFNCTGL